MKRMITLNILIISFMLLLGCGSSPVVTQTDSEIAELEEQHANLRAVLDSKEAEIETLRNQINQKSERITELENIISTLKEDLESLSSTTEPEPAAMASAIEVTAQELYSAYDANHIAADLKYKDKILKVTGTVIEIGKDFSGTPYVTLRGGTTYLESLMRVQCMFINKDEPALAQLTKGQTVTVQGKVSSYRVDVYMKDCTLVR